MRQAVGIALTGILFGALTQPGFAQSAVERGPDGKTQTVTAGIEVLPFPGLPFIGTDTIVRTVPVVGGSSVVTSETSKVIRDSQGRIYRERHHFAVLGTDPQKTLHIFQVLDPLTHTFTECTIATRRCTITGYHPRLTVSLQPAGPFDGGKRILTRESLGEQTAEGLNVIGTRETTTILPGAVGNDRTLTLTREFWYSPDLKNNISVTRIDPREGTVAIHLAILSRSEPDPGVLAIPSEYVVVDLRAKPRPSN